MNSRELSRRPLKTRSPDLRALIWDLPTRLFHWSLVVGFGLCYLTGEDDRLALLHITSGYMVTGLLIFRLVWGVMGSRHARFCAFLRGPRVTFQYLRALLRGTPPAFAGHNPAGGVAIAALLLTAAGACVSGILLLEEVAWPPLEWLHGGLSTLMLTIAVIHVAGVLIGSWLHRENLIKAMLTGRKCGFTRESIDHGHLGAATLLAVALIALWIWSYRTKLF